MGLQPTHKIVLLTNHRPHVAGTDEGIGGACASCRSRSRFWDPDKHPNADAEGLDPDLRQDKRLPDKLAVEVPGILAWLVQGCLDWQRGGLTEPKEVSWPRRNTAAEDVLSQFTGERCVIGPEFRSN